MPQPSPLRAIDQAYVLLGPFAKGCSSSTPLTFLNKGARTRQAASKPMPPELLRLYLFEIGIVVIGAAAFFAWRFGGNGDDG